MEENFLNKLHTVCICLNVFLFFLFCTCVNSYVVFKVDIICARIQFTNNNFQNRTYQNRHVQNKKNKNTLRLIHTVWSLFKKFSSKKCTKKRKENNVFNVSSVRAALVNRTTVLCYFMSCFLLLCHQDPYNYFCLFCVLKCFLINTKQFGNLLGYIIYYVNDISDLCDLS